ncbi:MULTISPECIES: TIGR02611 family protein [Catenuloplanes]|uniref:Uncharacterized protein (TIGR02611 family) n=1 Tax=Catenuloplanes niger TaxID=587534 RepID=A0AAE3ZVF6_9ACTN|nr:TIGR02611 family protein [Catenuloplanes niger]MDR7325400.1 uncharacterized protein (TIGR02611 family) [Catenuloplanes niger]
METLEEVVRPTPAWRRRITGTLDGIRANPTGRIALKIGIGVLGAIVVAVGIVAIPLPGPGWGIVIVGLAIWAIEFAWARHLLHFTRKHVQAWTRWILRQPWPLRSLLGLLCFLFVSAIVWLSLRLTLGIDLIQIGLDLLARF